MRAASFHPSETERFGRLTDLVAILLDVPVALVSLVDGERQWFNSHHDLSLRKTARDVSFCSHAIVEKPGEPFVVGDASKDHRFRDNPLVIGDPHVRFYAGQVLFGRDGLPVGTLCAIDREPRSLDESQLRALRHLATLVEQELHLHQDAQHDVAAAERDEKKSFILDAVSEGLVLQDSTGALLEWNSAAERLLGLTRDELSQRTAADPRFVLTQEDGTPIDPADRPAAIVLRTGDPVVETICGLERPHLDRIWLRVSARPIADETGDCHVVSTFSDATAEVEERQRHLRLETDARRQADLTQASLDALEQGVILTDSMARISVANVAAERILGFTAAEITDLWARQQWESYDRAGNPLAFKDRPVVRAMLSGEPVIGELAQWRRKNGDLALLRMSCIPSGDDGDAMVVAFNDITNEDLAQRLLDVTMETAPAGLAILDRDGKVTRCNPAFADQVGRTADDLVGASAFDLMHPDDQRKAQSDQKRLFDGSTQHIALDHRVLRPNGEERWVHTQVAVVPFTQPRIAIASTFDITERRKLLRDVSRFSFLFEQSNDMITVIDELGVIQYSSPATGRILGHVQGTRPADSIYDIIHPDDVDKAAAALATVISSHAPSAPYTARTRTADGQWLHIEYVGVDLLDEPAVAGIMITGRDVTERVMLTAQFEHQASHDPLTKLANRRAVESEIERGLARTSRAGGAVGLCFVDLDGFKAINDEHGHAAGDAALKSVAECLRNTLRTSDLAGRVGGDEFVAVLDPVESLHDVVACAERIKNAIEHLASTTDQLSGLGASVGTTISERGDTALSILERADTAMYESKLRNRSSFTTHAGAQSIENPEPALTPRM